MKWPIVGRFVERWVNPDKTLLLAHFEVWTLSLFGRGRINEPWDELALTLAIELPTVIRALNVTRVRDASKRQGGVPVRTAIK